MLTELKMDLLTFFALLVIVNSLTSIPAVGAKWRQSKSGRNKKDCANGHCHPQCYPSPFAMEGPFYVPAMPFRSDVREGKEGIPLELKFTLKDYHNECEPVANADIHIWQPDALGVYSAYLGYYPLGKPGSKQITGEHAEPTDAGTFLRGVQKTDENGKVTFLTVYPGWYLHRALHIHFKVLINGEDIYTGEVYFPEEISDQVAKVKPYSDSKEVRAGNNNEDWLFQRLDGYRSVANISGDVRHGMKAILDVVIEPTVELNNEL